jgi:hypothetical protein
VIKKTQLRWSRHSLGCSCKNLMLCYTLAVVIVFTYVQIFVKNTEQLLLCFTIRIVREIACSRKNLFYLIFYLYFSGLKSPMSNICPYFYCPGFIIVQQHTHCRNFIHFIFFFLSSSPSHLPLLTRPNNILQTRDHNFAENIPLYLCT